jgi:secondary thiamine-phosphate synthase enzyme
MNLGRCPNKLGTAQNSRGGLAGRPQAFRTSGGEAAPLLNSFWLVHYNPIMHMLKVRSHQREELLEFTDEVQRKLTESGAKEGVVVLYVQHTTAGLTVNENADPDVPRDLLHLLRTVIPQHGMGFHHGEENSDAHIKASLVGSSVTVPFTDGKLLLGRWQGIFLCEFDGGRERKVIMMVR